MRLCLLIAMFATASVHAAAQSSDTVETYAEIVHANYVDAHADAVELQAAIQQLTASPSESTLARARSTWLEARESYGQTEAFRFYGGPIDGIGEEAGWREDVEGPESRLNAWPLNEAFIDYVEGNSDAGIVNDPSVVLTAEALVDRNAITDEADVTTGYHAIEFLLWGQDLSTDGSGARPVSDYVGESESVVRRRAYLQLVTDLLVTDLESLVKAWKPNATNFRAKFVSQPVDAALAQIMTGMATLSGFELASERIAVPLDSGDQEDEHSCFSDNTHRDFVANAQAIRNVWLGTYGAVDGAGIVDVVRDAAPELATRIEQVNKRSVELAESIQPPVDRILATPPDAPARKPLQDLAEALYEQAELLLEAGRTLGLEVAIAGE